MALADERLVGMIIYYLKIKKQVFNKDSVYILTIS